MSSSEASIVIAMRKRCRVKGHGARKQLAAVELPASSNTEKRGVYEGRAPPMRGQMPMLKPTAALRESLVGLAPCFRYDQKGSVTCTPGK